MWLLPRQTAELCCLVLRRSEGHQADSPVWMQLWNARSWRCSFGSCRVGDVSPREQGSFQPAIAASHRLIHVSLIIAAKLGLHLINIVFLGRKCLLSGQTESLGRQGGGKGEFIMRVWSVQEKTGLTANFLPLDCSPKESFFKEMTCISK